MPPSPPSRAAAASPPPAGSASQSPRPSSAEAPQIRAKPAAPPPLVAAKSAIDVFRKLRGFVRRTSSERVSPPDSELDEGSSTSFNELSAERTWERLSRAPAPNLAPPDALPVDLGVGNGTEWTRIGGSDYVTTCTHRATRRNACVKATRDAAAAGREAQLLSKVRSPAVPELLGSATFGSWHYHAVALAPDHLPWLDGDWIPRIARAALDDATSSEEDEESLGCARSWLGLDPAVRREDVAALLSPPLTAAQRAVILR